MIRLPATALLCLSRGPDVGGQRRRWAWQLAGLGGGLLTAAWVLEQARDGPWTALLGLGLLLLGSGAALWWLAALLDDDATGNWDLRTLAMQSTVATARQHLGSAPARPDTKSAAARHEGSDGVFDAVTARKPSVHPEVDAPSVARDAAHLPATADAADAATVTLCSAWIDEVFRQARMRPPLP